MCASAAVFRVGHRLLSGHTAWLEKNHVGAKGAEWAISFPGRCLIAGRVPWFYLGKLAWLSRLPDAEEMTAHDIRAGFAVVLAALVGKGKFIVNNVHLIDRGYERLEERLRKIGAKIERKTL